LDGRKVKDTYTAVKKNVSNLSRRERLGEIALKLKGLKRVTGLKQKHLAEVCGVSRVQVSRWEHSLDLPSAKALLAISELATGEERQWWRDCAAERTGLGSAGNTTLEIFEPAASGVTIPLISNPKRVGSLGTLSASDVELQFSLPHSWFQDGGAIQAAKINATSISPLIEGEVIAIIDASQKDPDRLVGCTVAIQTVNGIEIRKLLRDRKTYILLPLEGHGSVNLWRPSGENSIAGKVVRWISQPRG
jgi:transcriptional regulator with XRE-family HTH domain